MKKSAAGLSNICIFSTMVIITVLCTVSLTVGQEESIRFCNPFDVRFSFSEGEVTKDENSKILEEFYESAKNNNTLLQDVKSYRYGYICRAKEENLLRVPTETDYNNEDIRIISIEDYNEITGENLSLEKENEIYFYTKSTDWGYNSILLDNVEYCVKGELEDFILEPKETKAAVGIIDYIVVKDAEMVNKLAGDSLYYGYNFNIKGNKENCENTVKSIEKYINSLGITYSMRNIYDWGGQVKSMEGGLLFIGIFFGILFMVCLVLIMYYKQISEGLEDQDTYRIMKKVGMSKQDIKKTINTQILWVFSIPLITAVIHTFASLNMTMGLLNTINLYDTAGIIFATFIVIFIFAIFYGISYLMTAKTYYKLVR